MRDGAAESGASPLTDGGTSNVAGASSVGAPLPPGIRRSIDCRLAIAARTSGKSNGSPAQSCSGVGFTGARSHTDNSSLMRASRDMFIQYARVPSVTQPAPQLQPRVAPPAAHRLDGRAQHGRRLVVRQALVPDQVDDLREFGGQRLDVRVKLQCGDEIR